MKFLVLVALLSNVVLAGSVKGVRFNERSSQIEVDVQYGGGCGDHLWDLELVGGCLESLPVQCSALLTHVTDDTCEGLRFETLKFDLDEVGLDDNYYVGARISIFSASDRERNISYSLQLPSSL